MGNKDIATQRVAQGVAWLDQRIVEWDKDVDLGQLAVADARYSVPGQIAKARNIGSHLDFMVKFGISDEVQYELGFSRHISVADYSWSDLHTAWIEAIQRKRADANPCGEEPVGEAEPAAIQPASNADQLLALEFNISTIMQLLNAVDLDNMNISNAISHLSTAKSYVHTEVDNQAIREYRAQNEPPNERTYPLG